MLFIGVGFSLGLNKYLDNSIENSITKKDLVPIMNDSLSTVKDKGIIVNDFFLNNQEIMMLGSSELGHSTKQHPTYYFNTNRSKNKLFTIGRAYTQSFQDATIVGSTNPNVRDKKVVLLISMQWFMDANGVTNSHYQGRFSPVQFYAFLDNPKISQKLKFKFVNRVGELLTGSDEFAAEKVYAKLYISKKPLDIIEKTLLYPYFEVRRYSVKLKEKGDLFKSLAILDNKKPEIKGEPIDWQYEKKQAIEDAKKRVGKNIFNIDKGYYKKYFKHGLKNKKNKYINVKLNESKEFEDLDFSFEIYQELGIKPVVVLLPSMDKFYDFSGITKDKRDIFYDKVQTMVKNRGFEVIDLRSKETEKYYLRDVMHLGTKGWVDVCEKLFEIFKQ